MKRVLLCAALIAWSAMASAVVYRWADAQGKVQYGDRPPDGVNAVIVDMLGRHTGRSASSRQPEPATAQTSRTVARDPTTQDDSAKKAVDQDVAQTREKQCAEAQQRYKKLIEGRRLYKAGTDGERQYLTSAEIDSERLAAKVDIDSICNSPT